MYKLSTKFKEYVNYASASVVISEFIDNRNFTLDIMAKGEQPRDGNRFEVKIENNSIGTVHMICSSEATYKVYRKIYDKLIDEFMLKAGPAHNMISVSVREDAGSMCNSMRVNGLVPTFESFSNDRNLTKEELADIFTQFNSTGDEYNASEISDIMLTDAKVEFRKLLRKYGNDFNPFDGLEDDGIFDDMLNFTGQFV